MDFLLRLISFLTTRPIPSEMPSRPILRDFPNCGQLGSNKKTECFWGCDWEDPKIKKIFSQQDWLEFNEEIWNLAKTRGKC